MTTTDPTALDLDAIRPATDLLIGQIRDALGKIKAHEHPTRGEDFFCFNLVSWAGERMGPVLRRLADEQAEVGRLRAELTVASRETTRLRAERDAQQQVIAAARRVLAAGHLDWDGRTDVEAAQGDAHAALAQAVRAVDGDTEAATR